MVRQPLQRLFDVLDSLPADVADLKRGHSDTDARSDLVDQLHMLNRFSRSAISEMLQCAEILAQLRRDNADYFPGFRAQSCARRAGDGQILRDPFVNR